MVEFWYWLKMALLILMIGAGVGCLALLASVLTTYHREESEEE